MKPYYSHAGITIFAGDTLQTLREMDSESVHCVVTSPPYWRLRDYGVAGQMGLEKTPDCGRPFIELTGDENAQQKVEILKSMLQLPSSPWEAPMQRDVRQMLLRNLEGRQVRQRSEVEGEGIRQGVQAASDCRDSADDGTQPSDQVGSHQQPWWVLRLLWGNNARIPDGRSHQRGWSAASPGTYREGEGQFDQDIQGYTAAGIPKGSISSPVFQLQLRDWLLGILPALRFRLDAVPPSAARFFRQSLCDECYVCRMTAVFRGVKRVLRKDGTCWVNLGDSYTSGGRSTWRSGASENKGQDVQNDMARPDTPVGLKAKDLCGIPWRVAFALQDDGWWLRQDIIWCLSGGAWVYARTQKGEMPMMVKDLVRLPTTSVELWNGMKWTRVRSWTASTAKPGGTELVLRSGERITCTSSHYWPTRRGNVRTEDLQVGDVLDTCTLPDNTGIQPNYLTHDALWMMGLYLAEGSRADDTIQLALHADEMGWLPKLETIAQHYGGSCTHTLDGNALNVRMYGKVLVALLESYIAGADASTKHLKVAAWSLTNTALRSIMNGYLDGDCHCDSANNRFRIGFTRNYALERDLRVMAARLGATLTLRPTTVQGFGKSWPAFRGEWRWDRSGHHNEKPRSEIVAIRNGRARKFWDIEVKDEPHLFALASGVLTHNSKPNPMPESVTDRCTKAHEYLFLLTKSAKYYYDAEAIKEDCTADHTAGNNSHKGTAAYLEGHEGHRTKQGLVAYAQKTRKVKMPDGWDTGAGGHGSFHRNGREKGETRELGEKGEAADSSEVRGGKGASFGRGAGWRNDPTAAVAKRNKRSVWEANAESWELRVDLSASDQAYVLGELVRRGLLTNISGSNGDQL
jgi:hypothetical protein